MEAVAEFGQLRTAYVYREELGPEGHGREPRRYHSSRRR
jgi:hypothetical protein